MAGREEVGGEVCVSLYQIGIYVSVPFSTAGIKSILLYSHISQRNAVCQRVSFLPSHSFSVINQYCLHIRQLATLYHHQP